MTDPDSSPALTQFTYSAGIIYLLQLFKGCPRIPWINQNSAKVNRIIAVVASFVSAVGVHWTVTGSFDTGWVFSGTIPKGMELLGAAWDVIRHVGQSFIAQETMYQMLVNRPVEPLIGTTILTPMQTVSDKAMKDLQE